MAKVNNKRKKSRKKYKWIKPKDFQFIKPIKWLPGFRSGKHWKRVVALLYLSITPFTLVLKFTDALPYFGVYIWVMLLMAPFMVLSFASFIKTRDRYYIIEAIIAAAVFAVDNFLLTQALQGVIGQL